MLRRPAVQTKPRPRIQPSAPERLEAMRRAAVLYLTSRECVARDVAFMRIAEPRDSDPGAGTADIVVWAPGKTFAVAFAHMSGRDLTERQRERVTRVGGLYFTVRAETPAHAVEKLAQLIDGGASR